MVKTNELRIGNKLIFQRNETTREIVTVAWISDDSIGYNEQHEASYPHSPKDFDGIPLTQEWLLKFRFEKVDHINGYSFFINKAKIAIYEHKTEYKGYYLDNHCKYVHQLQNLFFALTGKGLELNEPVNL